MSGTVILPASPVRPVSRWALRKRSSHQGGHRPIGRVKRGMLDWERAKPTRSFDASRIQGNSDGLAVDPSRDGLREDDARCGVREDRPALLVLFQHAGPELLGKLERKDQSDDLVDPGRGCPQILITDQTVGLVEAGERVRAIFHQECHQSLFESTRLEVEVAAQSLVQVDKEALRLVIFLIADFLTRQALEFPLELVQDLGSFLLIAFCRLGYRGRIRALRGRGSKQLPDLLDDLRQFAGDPSHPERVQGHLRVGANLHGGKPFNRRPIAIREEDGYDPHPLLLSPLEEVRYLFAKDEVGGEKIVRDQENGHACPLHGLSDFREPVLPCADTLVIPDVEKSLLAEDRELLHDSVFQPVVLTAVTDEDGRGSH